MGREGGLQLNIIRLACLAAVGVGTLAILPKKNSNVEVDAASAKAAANNPAITTEENLKQAYKNLGVDYPENGVGK